MLPRRFRLSSRSDIEKVLKRGKILRTEYFSMRFLATNLPEGRAGFVVSSSAARKAAGRNLLKRRAREIVHKKIKNFTKGYDVLFIFFKTAALLSFSELKRSLEDGLARAGIL